jgi:hypothetical protein
MSKLCVGGLASRDGCVRAVRRHVVGASVADSGRGAAAAVTTAAAVAAAGAATAAVPDAAGRVGVVVVRAGVVGVRDDLVGHGVTLLVVQQTGDAEDDGGGQSELGHDQSLEHQDGQGDELDDGDHGDLGDGGGAEREQALDLVAG